MATLVDNFLADLDELDGGGDDDFGGIIASSNAAKMEVDEEKLDAALNKSNTVEDIVTVANSDRLREHLRKLDEFIESGSEDLLSSDEDFQQIIVNSNALSVEIDNDIIAIHKFVRDIYTKKFPELETLVLNPMDYVRVAKTIGNQMDLTLVDLAGILPNASIMVVTVTGSTTSGQPLAFEELNKVEEACDTALDLDAARTKILGFVTSRMIVVAPNVTALVGSNVAAQLVAHAGGLRALSLIPACNILVLGSKKKNLSGLSSKTQEHVGFIAQCDIVTNTAPSLRSVAARLVSTKVALAARFDALNTNEGEGGIHGQMYREKVEKRLTKLQEPPPAKHIKALPVPDAEVKKRRGGKRQRKMKEKFEVTELRKQANRVSFGVAEDTFRETGKGFGMLGKGGTGGKLRVTTKESKIGLSKSKRQKLNSGGYSHGGISTSGTSTAIQGLSSIAFTPVQGIELAPADVQKRPDSLQNKYFSDTAQFSKPKSNPNMPPPPSRKP